MSRSIDCTVRKITSANPKGTATKNQARVTRRPSVTEWNSIDITTGEMVQYSVPIASMSVSKSANM